MDDSNCHLKAIKFGKALFLLVISRELRLLLFPINIIIIFFIRME